MRLHSFQFKNNLTSYALVIGLGLFAGLFTEWVNLLPYDTLWSFSSIASAFGFWIITTTLVIWFSSSNLNAACNVFLYLSSMNFSFYLVQFILGRLIPALYLESFPWGLLRRFDTLALICALAGFVLYYWNTEGWVKNWLLALPVGGLAAETAGVALFLLRTHTYLFQLVLNVLGLALLAVLLGKRATNRMVFIGVAIVAGWVGFYLFYLPYV